MSAGAATGRLYYTDSYLREFTARVVDRADGGRRIYLDRTAFYPTSGGQPNDTGTLGGHAVADVIDEGDRIAHVLAEPANLDGEVTGAIDWTRRFDLMQQHTGQHLLSAVIEDMFGSKTVSVHFGDDDSSVTLDGDYQHQKLERRVNELLTENRPVTVSYEDAGTVKGLRKPSDRQGELRIVTIEGVDRSACGGTHVRATGEIGSIILLGSERAKKGTFLWFSCGLRAVSLGSKSYAALAKVAGMLSAPVGSAAEAVEKQSAQLAASEQARRRMERELAVQHAAAMHAAAPVVGGVRLIVGDQGYDVMEQLHTLANAILKHERVVFVGVTSENKFLVAASEDSGLEAGKLVREVAEATGGKGGGGPRIAQGAIPAAKADDAVAAIRAALARDR